MGVPSQLDTIIAIDDFAPYHAMRHRNHNRMRVVQPQRSLPLLFEHDLYDDYSIVFQK